MAADETGSGLNIFFDQTAESGFRQVRLGGYDRRDVDAYVSEAEQRLRGQQQRIERLEQLLHEAQQSEPTAVLPTIGEEEQDVGSRTSAILQMAQQQARQVVETAEQEAARKLEQARRRGQEITDAAARDAEDSRLSTQAHADAQRARLERETGGQVERSRVEAEILLDRARQQAAVIEHEAITMAEQTQESARRDADVLRQQASTQAAQWRLEADQTRTEVLTTLQDEHEQAKAALARSLAEHTAQLQRANEELGDIVAESARIRSEAVVEADEARTRVLRETENQIAVAQQQAQVSLQAATERHTVRLQNLKREIASLQERRQGIVSQLSHLSAMVNDTAGQFSFDGGEDEDSEDDAAPDTSRPGAQSTDTQSTSSEPRGPRPTETETTATETTETETTETDTTATGTSDASAPAAEVGSTAPRTGSGDEVGGESDEVTEEDAGSAEEETRVVPRTNR